MRLFFTAVFLLLFSSVGFAAQAPALNKMSAEQLQQYFAGKSIMHYDRRLGSDVAYFRSNGTLYIYGTGLPTVRKSTWTVITEPGKAVLCLFEASRRVPQAAGGKLSVRVCVDARDFVRQAVDVQQGDVLGISKRSKPSFQLGTKKTNFAKLKAGKL